MRHRGARSRSVYCGFQLTVLLLLSCAGLRAQEQQGNITGQIRLVDGSFPNDRLRVTLEGHGSIVDVTYCDSEGRFSFSNLPSNAYSVVVDTEGFQPFRLAVVVNPVVMQTNLVHVVLRPKPKASLQGSPDQTSGSSPDVINVAALKKKFPSGAVKEFEAGMKSEQRGEMDAAVRHYEAAIRQAPDFYPAINNLGIRHLQKGQLKEAEVELRRVIELNQNDAQAYFNLGNVLYMTQRNDEAKQTLEQGLRLAPASAMGHYLNGSVLTRLGDFKSAEEQLKTARDLDPKMSQAPVALATLYLQTGRQGEAVKMFKDFLREFPNDPMAPKVRDAVNKLSRESSP